MKVIYLIFIYLERRMSQLKSSEKYIIDSISVEEFEYDGALRINTLIRGRKPPFQTNKVGRASVIKGKNYTKIHVKERVENVN